MREVVIAAYGRSPFHFARKGALAGIRPDDLVAQVMARVMQRAGVAPTQIEDVVLGCSYPEAEQGSNIARISGFLAGFADNVPGMTINRFCGSSMSAVHYAAGQIALGLGDAFLCGGVESMSRVPQGGFNRSPNPILERDYKGVYMSMGMTAENVARTFGISREAQDELAVQSHVKAAAARKDGRLSEEIVAIDTPDGIVSMDGCIRPDTNLAALGALKPIFAEDGSVTAGTSSPLTDGASALLVCSRAFAEKMQLHPLARLKTAAVSACPPQVMGIGPISATLKALARSGLTVADLDVIEINEAFASQAIACSRALGFDDARVNVDGGALAIGHPLGATGARLIGKAASVLRRDGGQFALATQCIGGGQGIATILEAI